MRTNVAHTRRNQHSKESSVAGRRHETALPRLTCIYARSRARLCCAKTHSHPVRVLCACICARVFPRATEARPADGRFGCSAYTHTHRPTHSYPNWQSSRWKQAGFLYMFEWCRRFSQPSVPVVFRRCQRANVRHSREKAERGAFGCWAQVRMHCRNATASNPPDDSFGRLYLRAKCLHFARNMYTHTHTRTRMSAASVC